MFQCDIQISNEVEFLTMARPKAKMKKKRQIVNMDHFINLAIFVTLLKDVEFTCCTWQKRNINNFINNTCFVVWVKQINTIQSPALGTLVNQCEIADQWENEVGFIGRFCIQSVFCSDIRNVRYEKFPVSVYRKNYTDIISIPVFLW
jgi:hypothetical protein